MLEAAVVGKEDRDGLTKPRAFIVLKAPVADQAALGDGAWVDFVIDLVVGFGEHTRN